MNPENDRPESEEPVKAEIVDSEIINRPQEGAWSKPEGFGAFQGIQLTDTSAVLAIALAVSSWIILPIVGAIAALIFASKARRNIKRSNGQLTGTNLATAAQVIAGANIVAGIVVIWAIISIIRWIF